jgi:microcompartment protein CcmL/EutN
VIPRPHTEVEQILPFFDKKAEQAPKQASKGGTK